MAGPDMRIARETMISASNLDALVIGGGPAGAALGITLARGRRDVRIIEQTTTMHHKVCGEFISYEAANYADRLGVNLLALGAQAIHGVRLAKHRCIAECELPFPALSLTRRRLDEALLLNAQQEGAVVQRGHRVERLEKIGSGWHAHLSNGDTLLARSIFLASGKHDVAGHRRPPGTHNGLVAFKMYFRLTAREKQALRGWVELILFPGGYAGLQLTEDDDANLCLLVNRSTLTRCNNDWHRLFQHLLQSSEHLADRLQSAEPVLAKPLALSSIPYGMLRSHSEPGLWRLGDQAAVTPSFAGDGISIALHSAMLAAELYAHGGTSTQLAGRLHRDLQRPISLATSFSRLMVAAPSLAPALHAWPSLLGSIAKHTRVPASALAR